MKHKVPFLALTTLLASGLTTPQAQAQYVAGSLVPLSSNAVTAMRPITITGSTAGRGVAVLSGVLLQVEVLTPTRRRNNLLRPTGSSGFTGAVSVVDADGDGQDDVIAATFGGELAVYYQNNGAFGSPVVIAGTGATGTVAAADLNGDGLRELVTYRTTPTTRDNTLVVVPGTAARAYGTPRTIISQLTASGQQQQVIFGLNVADFNGDNRPDVLLEYGSVALLNFLAGTGNPAQPLAPDQPLYTGGSGVAVADFNADGRPDIAYLAGQFPSLNLSLALGTGTATVFGTPQNTPLPRSAGASAPVVTDADNDGRPDVAVGSPTDLNVFRNTGTAAALLASFYSATLMPFGSTNFVSLAATELNNDGRADFLLLQAAPVGQFQQLLPLLSQRPSATAPDRALDGAAQLYPNPAASGRFQLAAPAAAGAVRVLDACGRAVATTGTAASGIELTTPAPGLYLVEWQAPGRAYRAKLVVE